MFITKEYEIDGMKIVRCHTEFKCPICGKTLTHKDFTDRTVCEPGAVKMKYYLERRICKHCNIKHTLIPDFIVPRHLWSAATIVACLTTDKNDLIDGPDERTIARWRGE